MNEVIEQSEYFNIPTHWGPLHIHINYNDKGPTKVFCNLPPIGTEISSLASVVGVLLTKYLETGGDPSRIIKHLNSIKSDSVTYWNEIPIESIPHAIGLALQLHLEGHK